MNRASPYNNVVRRRWRAIPGAKWIEWVGDAMTRVSKLDQALRKAGIPIHGVSSGPPVRIDFRDEATAEQRLQAARIEASFSYQPRKPRDPAAIITDLDALSQSQWRKAVSTALASLLRGNPDLLIDVGIDGEEPQ